MEERGYTILCCIITCLMDSFTCQILLVTGGYDSDGSNYTDSTEIFSDNVWRTLTAKLPLPMDNMEVASINNRVLLFGKSFLCCLTVKCVFLGGYSTEKFAGKDILEFNLQTESWTVIGAMKEPRLAHAVSVVSSEDYEKWSHTDCIMMLSK